MRCCELGGLASLLCQAARIVLPVSSGEPLVSVVFCMVTVRPDGVLCMACTAFLDLVVVISFRFVESRKGCIRRSAARAGGFGARRLRLIICCLRHLLVFCVWHAHQVTHVCVVGSL